MMLTEADSRSCNDTIADLLRHRRAFAPSEAALYHWVRDDWKMVTWKEYGELVDALARALLACGATSGDSVALIGHNTLNWFVSDMAIMTSGLVTVPIYETSSRDQMLYILRHSEAKFLIVENAKYLERVPDVFAQASELRQVVVLAGAVDRASVGVVSVKAFLDQASSISADELTKAREKITPDSAATLLYTSGTTGAPKAVILTHRNGVAAARNVQLAMIPDWGDGDRQSISYLPLSHVAERVVSMLSPMLDGRTVYISSDLDKIMDVVRQVRPTIWLAVPRVWEKMHEAFRRHRDQLPSLRGRLVDWSLDVGRRYNRALQEKERVDALTYLKHVIARKLVIGKLLESLGLEKVRIAITGGAPTRPEVTDFFSGLGLWLQEVYGQTEGYGATSLSVRSDYKAKSCGRAFPLVDIRIADDGEILVRGDNVSPGYYKEHELTAATFRDGWLHSGDLGRLDNDGFLWVIGRKKDIIITSGGKNISPTQIEHALSEPDIVNGAVVVGDGRKYLSAIVDVSRAKVVEVSEAGAGTFSSGLDLRNEEALKTWLDKHVARVNSELSRPEQIKKYLIVFDEFSQDSGLLTNTLKVRRHAVLQKFAREIDRMYLSDG